MSTDVVRWNVPRGLVAIADMAPAVFLPNDKAAERFYGSSGEHPTK